MDRQKINPLYAISCLLKGLSLLTKTELRRYLLIPVLINIILYGLAFTLGYFYLNDLINNIIPSWLSWLEWLIWPLFLMSFSALGFFTFTLLANIIAAPFYGQLAIATWTLISGKRPDTVELTVVGSIVSELSRISYLLSRMLPLLLLFIIPGINLIAPLLWALFSAWGIALEFMAYPMEFKGMNFAQQKQQARESRWAVLSFGGLTMLGLSIPIFNLVVAPAAVIGATIYFYPAPRQTSS